MWTSADKGRIRGGALLVSGSLRRSKERGYLVGLGAFTKAQGDQVLVRDASFSGHRFLPVWSFAFRRSGRSESRVHAV